MKLLLLLALCGAAIAQRNFACMPYVDPGPCRGLFPRYYYSSQERTCLSFLYGGCKGNLNNFVTFEECKASCAPTSDHERRCLARPEEGPCNGRAIMWGYNVTLGECQMFTYGGCDGSDNKYETKTMCEIVCKSDLPVHLDPVCLKPKYTGPCAGYFPRYYYNNTLKTCEQFIYGGCLSNGNNFVTIEECKNKCWVSPPEVCNYPVDSGPCLAHMLRFFYNTVTKACEQFVYSGCGGNQNNFRTYGACEKKCEKFMGVIPRA
ncbi:hypothetical protein V5799_002723 [Amblyomma americanum]|uniref:BPTI/Kunitz inhibitor domain-containing protein n=1 Tax=Amblyomma americanum TaxID=6943 RepID=A0AAQ4DB02_AMBAM